jgi:NAD(P)-dependent dehydrogenase (short-subunit alcohol dehydrogenase family)
MAQNGSSFNFTDKVAIVTDGSTGIGRITSLLFARQGAKVVIGDVNPEGRETVETIEQEGGAALFVETDVRSVQQVQHLVAAAVKTYGGLHFAFNNAGILPAAARLPLGGFHKLRLPENFSAWWLERFAHPDCRRFVGYVIALHVNYCIWSSSPAKSSA